MAKFSDLHDPRYKNIVFYVVSAIGLALWLWICRQNVFYGTSWLDEGKYLIQGLWAASGRFPMYGPEGSSAYPPIYYYTLGYLQMIFGTGAGTTRVFSSVLSLVLIYLTVKHLDPPKRRWLVLLVFCVFFANRGVMRYFNTGTPYVFVAVLSLITTLFIFHRPIKNIVKLASLMGFLYFLLYFSRLNMILAIPVFFLLHLYLLDRSERVKYALISIGTFIVFSVVLCALFDPVMRYHMITLPMVTKTLREIGLLPDPFSLANEMTFWTMEKSVTLTSTYENFLSSFVYRHPWFFWGSVIGGAICFVNPRKYLLGIFGAAYYLYMGVTHTFGSQPYCPRCVGIYTQYFSIYSFFPIYFGSCIVLDRLGQSSILVRIRPVVIIAAWAIVMISSAKEVKSLIAAVHSQPKYNDQVREHAAVIADHVPDEEVLLLAHSPVSAQAAVYAGKVYQVTGINPRHSYRVIKSEPELNREDKERLISQLLHLGKWNEYHLNYWVSCRYNYIIRAPGSQPIDVDIYKDRFEKIASHKRMTIWRRVEPPPPECEQGLTLETARL